MRIGRCKECCPAAAAALMAAVVLAWVLVPLAAVARHSEGPRLASTAATGAAILRRSWRAPAGRAVEPALSRPPLLSSTGCPCTWQHAGCHYCPSFDLKACTCASHVYMKNLAPAGSALVQAAARGAAAEGSSVAPHLAMLVLLAALVGVATAGLVQQYLQYQQGPLVRTADAGGLRVSRSSLGATDLKGARGHSPEWKRAARWPRSQRLRLSAVEDSASRLHGGCWASQRGHPPLPPDAVLPLLSALVHHMGPPQLGPPGPRGGAAGSCVALPTPDHTDAQAGQGAGVLDTAHSCFQGLDSATWPEQLSPSSLEFVTDVHGQIVLLGEGSHAVVYLARMHGSHLVAVKVFELQPYRTLQLAWREATILQRCAHRRIVPFCGVTVQGSLLMLVTRFMEGASLSTALCCSTSRARLHWEKGGRRVAMDVAEGLHFLHSHAGVVHGDLKLSNILLTAHLRACINDLGGAQLAGSQAMAPNCFSKSHAAPELLLGQPCTPAVDMYSFGILLIELTTSTLAHKRGVGRLPQVPAECSQSVLELIQRCISTDPRCRPSAAQALLQLGADAGSTVESLFSLIRQPH